MKSGLRSINFNETPNIFLLAKFLVVVEILTHYNTIAICFIWIFTEILCIHHINYPVSR